MPDGVFGFLAIVGAAVALALARNAPLRWVAACAALGGAITLIALFLPWQIREHIAIGRQEDWVTSAEYDSFEFPFHGAFVIGFAAAGCAIHSWLATRSPGRRLRGWALAGVLTLAVAATIACFDLASGVVRDYRPGEGSDPQTQADAGVGAHAAVLASVLGTFCAAGLWARTPRAEKPR